MENKGATQIFEFDKAEKNVKQGTGQIRTFKQLSATHVHSAKMTEGIGAFFKRAGRGIAKAAKAIHIGQ